MRNEKEPREERELPKGVVRSRPLPPTTGEALTPGPSPSERRGGPDTGTTPASRQNRAEKAVGEAWVGNATGTPLPARSGNQGRGVGGEGNRITAIEAQEKRKGRVSVFVDGKFAIGLFEEVALSLGLRVGQAITPERLEEVAKAETRRRALEDAYRLLSFRARSEQERTDRLQRKGYEEDAIAEALGSLRAHGYVDDAQFAGAWVRSRGQSRGKRALAFELKQKGVAGEVTAQALAEEMPADAERESARSAAIKKIGARPADTSREAKAKLAAFLQRRGFGWDTIRPVLAELYEKAIDEETDEDAEDAEELTS